MGKKYFKEHFPKAFQYRKYLEDVLTIPIEDLKQAILNKLCDTKFYDANKNQYKHNTVQILKPQV